MQIRQSDAFWQLEGSIFVCMWMQKRIKPGSTKKKKKPVAISELAAIFNRFTLESTCLYSENVASFLSEPFGNKLGMC